MKTLRIAVATLVACSPVAAILWTGCSSSSSSGGASGPVDPGGTFGVEVALHIQGSGHITSFPAGIDCPTGCYRQFIFDPNSDAAKNGLALTARPGEDWKFTGWTFNTTTASARGPGPEICQPYSRATSPAPGGVDPSNPQLVLPAGQVPATAPATATAQQLACAGGQLPVAYDLTANFVYAPIPDAGPDVGGDANDGGGGEGEILYASPQVGAVGKSIWYRSSRLIWQWDASGQSTLSTGSTFVGSSRTDVVGPGTFINLLRVDYAAVYQNQALTLGDFVAGTSSTSTLPSPPTCAAVTSDSTYVYCRTTGNPSSIVRWTLSGSSGPTTIASQLPGGNDLAVDLSYLYYSDTTGGAVYSIPMTGIGDGGAPDTGAGSATLIASGQQSPTGVQVYSSNVYWTTNDGFGTITILSASRFGGGTPTTLASRSSIKTVWLDSLGGYVFYTVVPSSFTGASSIYRVSMSGGASTPLKTNLTNTGGVTADSSYVYWTGADAKVYRATKF